MSSTILGQTWRLKTQASLGDDKANAGWYTWQPIRAEKKSWLVAVAMTRIAEGRRPRHLRGRLRRGVQQGLVMILK
jgi:hypothetical protein